jgi:hypothetical protein
LASGTAMMRAAALALLPAVAFSHGGLITPRSRNSWDYTVNVNAPSNYQSNKDCTNISGADPGDCRNGQAGFYYSQGCSIGCAECDHVSGRVQTDICGSGMKATLPEYARSLNLNSTAGSPNDIYKHNPWRAPGSAPVGDVCGLAGGTPWLPDVGNAGDYTTTKFAHHGTNGSLLPKMDNGVVWHLGQTAEVSWQVLNNHGGGYSYRLCPATEKLTEACFKAHPLSFVREEHAIVDRNHKVFPVNGTFVTEGTFPPGSEWARIPIPSDALGARCVPGPNDTASTPNRCLAGEEKCESGPCAPCPQTSGSDCSRCDNNWPVNKGTPAFPPPTPGAQGCDHSHAIRDVLKVPNLPAGAYVLGWRYDCEATAQVWSNCADITLAPPPPPPTPTGGSLFRCVKGMCAGNFTAGASKEDCAKVCGPSA